MHHASPVLYKHIHAIHHEYRAPFCWVTQHEHVLELLVVSIWSVLVPMGLGCHPLTTWLFLLGAIQVSVEAHSGYTAGLFAPLEMLLPFGLWGGSVHHDNHHKAPRRNFQPFFTYLDRAFGTIWDEAKDAAAVPAMHRLEPEPIKAAEHEPTKAAVILTVGGRGGAAEQRATQPSEGCQPVRLGLPEASKAVSVTPPRTGRHSPNPRRARSPAAGAMKKRARSAKAV